jgi:hypothetical protein
MDCRTASLLIEAYHDDELELVDAAHLLAHLEECPDCRCRCDEAGRLRDTVRSSRPVDRCPEELAKRLARRMDVPVRGPRRAPRPLVVVLAGGCGLLAGWVGGRLVPGRGPAVFTAARRTYDADVFCLRCALRALFPARPSDAGPHRPVLRTADGRLWVVEPASAERAHVADPGPEPRHVVVDAILDDRTGLADVSAMKDAQPQAAR